MKTNINTLKQYLFEYSEKEYRKETVNGLFRAILEPVTTNQKFESCILLRINSTEDKHSILRRLTFTGSKIYSFNENLSEFKYAAAEKENIWGNTEFLVLLGQRYSAALIWDFSLSEQKDTTPVCILYNSKIITDIAKIILNNSTIDFSELIKKYSPDRRENLILNKSISVLSSFLNDKNEEVIFSENEKEQFIKSDDSLKTAQIIADKAKFISHEIKNNVSIINLYSTIAKKRLENVKGTDEVINSLNNALSNVLTASENVSSLITDLRCLSTPYMTEISIKSLITTTISMCKEKANKAGVNILENKMKDCIITSDKTKLQCILTNIIYNAIEACKPNCSISTDCYKEKEQIKICIKNNGNKIPKEIQEKIFEPDFTTKEKGNGLGLAICKQQISLIGGNIKLLHSNDIETVFEITLPL